MIAARTHINCAYIHTSVEPDGVAGHGVAPHIPQTIIAGSNNVYIGGIAVVNAGDGNSVCGHTASGSSDVFVGD